MCSFLYVGTCPNARAQKHVPKNHEEIFIVGNTYATLYYRSIRNMNTIKIKRVPVSVITKFKLWRQGKPSTRGRLQVNAKVGLFYSTSTGNTEAAAEWIQEKFAKHGDIAAPVDICEANVSDMQAFDSLIVGAPTWNTGGRWTGMRETTRSRGSRTGIKDEFECSSAGRTRWACWSGSLRRIEGPRRRRSGEP